MFIGIDASRAFVKNRTGIEEYSYQVIKNLRDKLNGHEVVLYSRNSKLATCNSRRYLGDIELPEKWSVKTIKLPYLWTQLGLSLEMLLRPVDILFISAHTVPIIHPKNTIVVIHGLEYEFYPEAYSRWERFYMRRVIKNSCRWAKTIIAVSKNTKRDLVKLYGIQAGKIRVICEGYNRNFQREKKLKLKNLKFNSNFKFQISNLPYLLFIGRLEKRKNITGIIKAFEILKEKYNIPHKLVLAGMPGYGYESIEYLVLSSKYKGEIIKTGYVSEENKRELLKNADVFLFPTFYEGFGLPILEAQSMGTPVVAGDNSSIPEVAGFALLVNPHNPKEIAEAAYKLISDKNLRDDIIKKGYKNMKRFSWEKCANSIAKLLTDKMK
ncbi:glycosyltransferase family 4 protein [bacterium]|nr:glycosyltransferase family 4 protein [bacterium]